MSNNKLSTESYKGVRDFYPKDMAIQRYIFNTWSKTAEAFGFERYDASILEPAELYRSKGSASEEIVNEQTYTFTDRGNREVTLRTEMTPTVARMVAGKRRDLTFPLRWYSIPNLFRYERPQKGRLREHWQLNCDIFGATHYSADVEIISLAHQTLIEFGATPDMFQIKLNNREEMTKLYNDIGITDEVQIQTLTRLNDRKNKITVEDYQQELLSIVKDSNLGLAVVNMIENKNHINEVLEGLQSLGITNAIIDRSIARGFDYYTGTIFEIMDTSAENNRSLLGGGRYDNLTSLFGEEPIVGVGFGMGDVTMRDFLETHNLLENKVPKTGPVLSIIPTDSILNLEAEKIAHQFRRRGVSVTVDFGTKKLGKKISDAVDRNITYALIIGADELGSGTFTLKNLPLELEETGTLPSLITYLIAQS